VAGLRSFVALPLPPDVLEALGAVCAALREQPWQDRVRWVPEANLHVTLQFLGSLDPDRRPGVEAAIDALARESRPFDCRVRELRAFPSRGRARVLVAALADDEALRSLAEGLGAALAQQGFAPEARRFRPHVTLGRVRRPPLREAGAALRTLDFAPVDFTARELVLFASELHTDGARYTPLARFPLG
jgi:2'-5' RNA ligase